jgi:endonuclease YncB( thermonuclease family)
MLPLLLMALALAFPCGLSAQPEKYRGQVVSVADGDTITVLTTDFERIKVRFYGIDCPEKDQPYGQEAKNFLTGLINGKTVDIEVMDIDRYSRYVGLVRFDGALLNQSLVEGGYAWLYEQYCEDKLVCGALRAGEKAARSQKRGLWSEPSPTPPWDWRKAKRSK